MYSFKICFAFDSAKPINYTNYAKTFEKARKQFNENAIQRGNGRSIEKIDLSSNEFYVVLHSCDKLDKPSKSLAKFSQYMISSGQFDDYTNGNHLLRSKSVKDISQNNTISDATLLSTLVHWILNEDKTTSATMKERQRQTIEEIKRVILNAEIIVN